MPGLRPPKRRLWPWVVLSLACTGSAALLMRWSQPWLFSSGLYSGQEGRLRAEPGLPGQINNVQISEGGVVWVQAKDSLCRQVRTDWDCTPGESTGAGSFYSDFLLVIRTSCWPEKRYGRSVREPPPTSTGPAGVLTLERRGL